MLSTAEPALAMVSQLAWERPAMLAALPVALAPLWLARRRMRSREAVVLPTAELLRGLTGGRRDRAEGLLTAARMVLLAAVVCAFAGPTWSSRQPASTPSQPPSRDALRRTAMTDSGEKNSQIVIVGPRGTADGPSVGDLLAHALSAGDRWPVRQVEPQDAAVADVADAAQVWLADHDGEALRMNAAWPTILSSLTEQGKPVIGVGHALRTDARLIARSARTADGHPTALFETVPRDLGEGLPAIDPVLPAGSALSPQLAAALAQAVVLPRWHTRAAPGALVHLALADGEPVVVEGRLGRSPMVVIALDLSWRPADAPAADLPRRGAFAWFVQELADHLSDQRAAAPHPRPHDPMAATQAPSGSVDPGRTLRAALLLAAVFAWFAQRLLTTAPRREHRA